MNIDNVEETLASLEAAPPIESLGLVRPLPGLGLVDAVSKLLGIDSATSVRLVSESERLYVGRMRERFTSVKVSDRLKRTNPFLLQIRGAKTVEEWARIQVTSALFASEEEAVGHLLEMIAITCYPGASTPTYPEDFDIQATGPNGEVLAYQIKMSWDCMPMSSRKNLSNTIRSLKEIYRLEGRDVVGYFAPCYGKAKTTRPKGQEYVSLRSREFWSQVGGGDQNFDVRVGEVCALLCSEFRAEVIDTLVPALVAKLTAAAAEIIGDVEGNLDYERLFRRVNR